jgi:hypothetical protein
MSKDLSKLVASKTIEERLQMFMTGKLPEITKEEQEQLDKMSFCDDQLRRLTTIKEVAVMMQKKFRISDTTAYSIIRQTQVVFGSTNKSEKAYWRSIVADNIKRDLRLAQASGDTASASKLYGQLIKVMGLDKDDDNTAPPPPPPAVFVFVSDPKVLGIKEEDNLLQRVNTTLGLKAEDGFAEFKDVSNE